MRPFRYARAEGVGEALQLLAAEPQGRFLGGGTNLVDLMRLGIETPGALIDVTRAGETEITETGDGGVRIGAAVRNADLAADPLVRERYPMLTSAILQGASGQLRNLATTAGNLLQRTRCVYFQDTDKPCNKRAPGSGCPAIEGEHHNHAVLGASDRCIATHPSDMAVPLVALDAIVEVVGPDSSRSIPLTELHRLPGREPHRETVLAREELIVAVTIPPMAAARGSVYVKIRERASYAFALVSVAAALEVHDGIVHTARLALGGVAPKPWRAHLAETVLAGTPATRESFEKAAEVEFAVAEPLPGNAYKLPLARNAIVDALAGLAGIA